MRRVSQQIGWSQEAKLYYEWLLQLERLTAIVGKNIITTTSTTTIDPALCVINPGWATTNLNVDTYANGDPIPEVQDPTAWITLTTGAWCSYDNNPANDAIYGKLYNGYAVNDPRGLAPIGYHIPTLAEFQALAICLGGPMSGGKLKETGTTYWIAPNAGATNSSGFTALPGGQRYFVNGAFYELGEIAVFCGQSVDTLNNWYLYLNSANSSLFIGNTSSISGFSVRVIAD